MKICPVGAELFHADRWTDRQPTDGRKDMMEVKLLFTILQTYLINCNIMCSQNFQPEYVKVKWHFQTLQHKTMATFSTKMAYNYRTNMLQLTFQFMFQLLLLYQ